MMFLNEGFLRFVHFIKYNPIHVLMNLLVCSIVHFSIWTFQHLHDPAQLRLLHAHERQARADVGRVLAGLWEGHDQASE